MECADTGPACSEPSVKDSARETPVSERREQVDIREHSDSDQAQRRNDRPATMGDAAEKSPQALIDELKAKQLESDAEALKYTGASKALQADIGALAKDLEVADKAIADFEKNLPTLDQQVAERSKYLEVKRQMIVVAVGEDRSRIDTVWEEVQKQLDRLRKDSRIQRQELGTLIGQQAQKQQDVDLAREDFDAAQERLTVVKGRITALAALKTRIDAAEAVGNAADMYAAAREFDFQLEQAKGELEQVANKRVAKYRAETYAAWRALNQHRQVLRDATQAKTQKQAQLDQTIADIKRLEANRPNEVLRRFTEGKAKQPVAAPAW